jgi:uncharacterized protein YxeA
MKTKLIIITTAVVLICISAPLAFAQDTDKAAIDKYIAAQAKREHGEEYPDARKVVTGDLNGDGNAETAVLYTIEGQNGSNNHVQYLAVFKRTDGKLVPVTHTSVGSKSYRDVDLDSISKGLINLTTMGYAKNDPSCCPSLKGKAWYRLVGLALMPVRNRR